jgi:hypothetical protein
MNNLKCFPFYYKIRTASFGLSDGIIPEYKELGEHPNSYALHCSTITCYFSLAGEKHRFEFRPEKVSWPWASVFGCGLLLNPNDKLAIFFTSDGKIIGQFLKRIGRINLINLAFGKIICQIQFLYLNCHLIYANYGTQTHD